MLKELNLKADRYKDLEELAREMTQTELNLSCTLNEEKKHEPKL